MGTVTSRGLRSGRGVQLFSVIGPLLPLGAVDAHVNRVAAVVDAEHCNGEAVEAEAAHDRPVRALSPVVPLEATGTNGRIDHDATSLRSMPHSATRRRSIGISSAYSSANSGARSSTSAAMSSMVATGSHQQPMET